MGRVRLVQYLSVKRKDYWSTFPEHGSERGLRDELRQLATVALQSDTSSWLLDRVCQYSKLNKINLSIAV